MAKPTRLRLTACIVFLLFIMFPLYAVLWGNSRLPTHPPAPAALPGTVLFRVLHGGGLGNILYGYISCVLYSRVSGRQLVVDTDHFRNMPQWFQLRDHSQRWQPYRGDVELEVTKLDDCGEGFEGFDTDLPAYLLPTVQISTNCLLLDPIAHHQKLSALNLPQATPQLFSELFRTTLVPVPRIQARIPSLEARLTAGRVSIGLQIRTAFMATPEGSYNWSLEKIWSKFSEHARTFHKGEQDFVVFIASDHPGILQMARREFGARVVIVDGDAVHVGNPIEFESQFMAKPSESKSAISQRAAWEKMVLDWWALGLCDHLVITGWSTFGSTAAMRTAKTPWIVCPWGVQHGLSNGLDVESCSKPTQR